MAVLAKDIFFPTLYYLHQTRKALTVPAGLMEVMAPGSISHRKVVASGTISSPHLHIYWVISVAVMLSSTCCTASIFANSSLIKYLQKWDVPSLSSLSSICLRYFLYSQFYAKYFRISFSVIFDGNISFYYMEIFDDVFFRTGH